MGMISFPSRIGDLIKRLEAGDDPSPKELRRIATLQALDIAKIGEDFILERSTVEAQKTEDWRMLLELDNPATNQ